MSLRFGFLVFLMSQLVLQGRANDQQQNEDDQQSPNWNWENVYENQDQNEIPSIGRPGRLLASHRCPPPPTCPPPPPCPAREPKRSGPASLPLRSAPRKTLPAGYVRLANLPSAYKFHAQADDWAGARRACEREGAFLAVPNSQREARALVGLLAAAPNITRLGAHSPRLPRDHMHVGVHRVGDDWLTVQKPPVLLKHTGYVQWTSPSNPNHKNSKEDCLQLYNNLKYNDYFCKRRLAFACEMPLE